jgi:hypothetical protein
LVTKNKKNSVKLAEDEVLQQDQEKISFVHLVPLGSSGTENYSGYPQEEYLQALQGKERADVFDEMRRSDSNVKMCLSAVINPIKDAVWEVEAGDDTPEAQLRADFIKHVLFDDMDQTFEQFIGEALTVVPFGHAVFEITHKVVLGNEKFGNYNGIRSLGWRSPRTLERWNLDKSNGKLASVTQYAYGDLDRSVDMPAQFLLVLTMDKEGSNYEGISLLRPCYGNWYRKNVYLKLNAIGVEKFAVPTPIAKVPNGTMSTEARNALKEALEIYTTHQANYLMMPDGVDLELKTNAYDPEKVEKSIDNEDKRMTKSFLANFLELGMGTSGSYSLSNDLSDFFLSGINHIASDIAGAVNMKIIPELCSMNFADKVAKPKLKVSGISDKAGKELADILVALGGGKWLTPSDRDEDHLRKRLALPDRSLDGQRVVEAPKQFTPTLAERIRMAGTRERK